MSLAQLLAILRPARWSIVLMMLAAAATAFAFAASLPKEYTAKARVMLDMGNYDPNMFSALKKKTEDEFINTQIRLIRESGVTRAVVVRLGWPDDPSVVAAWQAATGGTGDVVKWAASRIATNIAVGQLEDSSILEIYYTASDVETAKRIVAEIRAAYIANNLSLRVTAAQRASAWNRTVAAKAFVTMRAAEKVRSDFMQANGIVDDAKLASLERRRADIYQKRLVTSAPTNAVIRPSSAMIDLRRDLNRTEAELVQLTLSLGADNPQTQAAMIRRNGLQAALAREDAFNRARSTATDAVVQNNRRLLDQEYLQARMEVLDRAPLYDRLMQIDREMKLKRDLYKAAAGRVQNFDMIAAAPTGVEVLGDVIASDEPSFPNIPVIVGLAAAFGLGLGVTLALFGEMMARRIRVPEDLGFFARVPVLAVIAAGPPEPRRPRAPLAGLAQAAE